MANTGKHYRAPTLTRFETPEAMLRYVESKVQFSGVATLRSLEAPSRPHSLAKNLKRASR